MNINNSSNNSTLLLFDSSMSFTDVSLIIKEKNPQIITFDYESHILLKKKDISHEISDSYATTHDLEYIQEQSYLFSKWFNESKISHLIYFEDINLGELFFNDFHYQLVPILKKIFEVKKIFESNKNSTFVTSNVLYKIIFSLTNLIIKLESNSQKIIDYDNSIKIPLKIGKFSFSIKLKYNYLKKLTYLFEKFNDLFSFSINSNNNTNILLIDFTTKKYKQIFKNSDNCNIIKFDRIIPAIWDLESYSTIKKSNCHLENYSSLMNNTLKQSINKNLISVKKNTKLLWEQNSFFESFFSLDGKSFWNVIKPILTKQYEETSILAIQEIELTKKLFKKYNFNSILVWSETMINSFIAIKLAKKQNIPIHLIQHGLYYDNPESRNFYLFQRTIPKHVDKFLVWGNVLEEYAIDVGFPKNNIKKIGSPIHDEIFLSKKNSSLNTNKFILLATSYPSQNFIHEFTVESLEKYSNSIKKICEVTSKLNKKLVIKLHPQSTELDISDFVSKIDSRITVIKAGDITPLIQSCEVFITMDLSTTMLEAQILEKPIISLQIRDFTANTEIIKSNSCLSVSLTDFENILIRILNDEQFRLDVIQQGTKFSKNYLSNLGSASKNILDFLSKNS
jgi:hypothetical protein